MGARGPAKNRPYPYTAVVPYLRHAPNGTQESYGLVDLAKRIARTETPAGEEVPASAVVRSAALLHLGRREGFTPQGAERVARALGVHMAEVWGDIYWRQTGAIDATGLPTWCEHAPRPLDQSAVHA